MTSTVASYDSFQTFSLLRQKPSLTRVEHSLILVMLGASVGSHAAIDKRKLHSIFFVYRPKIEIKNINELLNLPTWKYKELARSLYMVGEVGGQKTIEFKSTMFSEDTLGKMIYDLKKLNPTIRLDGYARKLMEKYKAHASHC